MSSHRKLKATAEERPAAKSLSAPKVIIPICHLSVPKLRISDLDGTPEKKKKQCHSQFCPRTRRYFNFVLRFFFLADFLQLSKEMLL